jgi:hypothetical protein
MRTSTKHALLTLVTWAAMGSAGARAQETEPGEVKQEVAAEPATAEVKTTDAPAEPVGKLRFYGGMRVGFGGHFNVDLNSGGSRNQALKATIGIQAGVDYVVMKYFAIGGEFRLGWWNTKQASDAGADRSLLVDFDVKPRGMYTFKSIPLELYGAIPIGLTIPSLDSRFNVDTNVGWNIGFGGGASWFFTKHMGVNLEGMGLLHYFSANTKGVSNGDGRVGQFNIFGNLVYAM